MYGSLDEIRLELEQMEYELASKLHEKETAQTSTTILETTATINSIYDQEKDFIVKKHIKNDLDDVKLAIMKMDLGIYGICEITGERIPVEKLKVLPTARKLSDLKFTYMT